MNHANLFTDIPLELPEEFFTTLFQSGNLRIERIVSQGHTSPEGFWYDQDQNEWVLVLQGSARLRLESEVLEMQSGDFVNIPAHQKHRVEWTTPDQRTVWLAIYYGDKH
jgi:cupin 2 domain-containing protein